MDRTGQGDIASLVTQRSNSRVCQSYRETLQPTRDMQLRRGVVL